MKELAYLSDVSPWWTMERQETALAAVLPSCTVYRDTLTVSYRRGHHAEALTERALMLRPSTKTSGVTIHVASMAVMASAVEDMRAVLTAIASLGVILCAVDDKLQLAPHLDGVEEGIAAWTAACTKSRLEGAARRGGAVSAARKKARVAAGAERIKDRWPLPSSEWKTASLLAEAGASRNAVNAILGGRELAQKRYQAAQKRKAKKL